MPFVQRRMRSAVLVLLLTLFSVPSPAQETGFNEPLNFQPNLGQEATGVRFVSSGAGYKVLLTDSDAILRLQNVDGAESSVRMKFVGGATKTAMRGENPLSLIANYFIGNDPAKWVSGVPGFGRVHLKAVYPGIDLVYYGNQGEVEFDFIVAPGTDPKQIAMAFEGAQSIQTTKDGNLKLTLNGASLGLKKPIVYQEVAGTRQIVQSSYVIGKDGQVRFALGAYDAGRTLVIDPSIAVFEYFGVGSITVSTNNAPRAVAINKTTGIAYVAGYSTPVSGVPTIKDAFIGRFDAACLTGIGCTRWTTTRFGGNLDDRAKDIAIDDAGDIWVIGSTASNNFPTLTPLQSFPGTGSNVFISKYSGDLTTRLYSTYLGGLGTDRGDSIALEGCPGPACMVYIAGTAGADLAGFGGATPTADNNNGFVARLTFDPAQGSPLGWGTNSFRKYIGTVSNRSGTGAGDNGVRSLALAAAANHAFVAGAIPGGDATHMRAQAWKVGNATSDATLNFHSTVNDVDKASFANGIAADAANVYVIGETNATAPVFPVNCGGAQFCQTNYNGGAGETNRDGFYARVDLPSFGISYATYLGSTTVSGAGAIDVARGVALDTAGNVLVTGFTRSATFPSDGSPLTFGLPGITPIAVGFLAAFTPENTLASSSFLRPVTASGQHEGDDVAAYEDGSALVVGATITGGVPNGPFYTKIDAPATAGPKFDTFSLCVIGVTPCTTTFFSSQDPTLGVPIATVRIVLTEALPAPGVVKLETLDSSNQPTSTYAVPTQPVRGDGKTWDFALDYAITVNPNTSVIKVRAVIDPTPGVPNDEQKCAVGNTDCYGTLTMIGIPGIAGVTFAPSYPTITPVAAGKVIGGFSTSAKVLLNDIARTSVEAFVEDDSPVTTLRIAPAPSSCTICSVSANGSIATPVIVSSIVQIDAAPVTAITSVRVSASLTSGGTEAGGGTLNILPDLKLSPLGLTLTTGGVPVPPTGVFSGTPVVATATLDNGAAVPVSPIYPVDGLTFKLMRIVSPGNEILLGTGFIRQGNTSGTITYVADTVSQTTIPPYQLYARIEESPETNLSLSNVQSLTINPITVVQVSMDSAEAIGGSTASGKIRLAAPAADEGGGGTVVRVQTNAPWSLDTTVLVPAGSGSGLSPWPFELDPPIVDVDTNFTVTATLNGVSTTAILRVLAAKPSSLTIDETEVPGGASITVRVRMDSVVPSDVTVPLTSSPSLTMPVLIVPAGTDEGSITFNAPSPVQTTTYAVSVTSNPLLSDTVRVTTPLSVTNLTVTPSRVASGIGSVTIQVTLSSPSVGGVTGVNIQGTWNTVQPVLIIPEGSDTGTITLNTPRVSETRTFDFAAGFSPNPLRHANVTVSLEPTLLELIPSTVISGGSVNAKVTLDGIAGSDVSVVLSSAGLTLPPITVLNGASTGQVTLTAPTVTSPQQYTIAATLSGVDKTAVLTVNPPMAPTLLELTPSTVASGGGYSAKITLNQPAPTGGTTVNLTGAGPASTVLVPAGQTTFTTALVAPKITTNQTFTLVASVGTNSVSAPLAVTLVPVSLTLVPATINSGGNVTATVTLNGLPSAQVSVTLSSSFSLSPILVNADALTGQITFAAPNVASQQQFTITASLNGTSTTAILTVNPAIAPTLLVLTPSTVASGGGYSATVTLNQPAPTGGTTVTFTGAGPATTVLVPAGQSTVTKAMTAPKVTTNQTFTLVASVGANSVSAPLFVRLVPVSLTLTPSTVNSGGSVVARVTLNGLPSAAVSVVLSSSFGLPPISVAADQTSGQITFAAPAVIAGTSFTITATLNGVSVSAPLQVNPVSTTVPFSKFNVDVAVGMKWGDDRDTFRVRGEFSLGTISNGINPVTEPVTLNVGPYAVTIPAGSFKLSGDRDGDGDIDRHGCKVVRRYRFQGTINGVVLDVRIRYFGNNEYDLRVHARKADMTGVVKGQPISVLLAVGNDSGTAVDLHPRVRLKPLDVKVRVDLTKKKVGYDSFRVDAGFVLGTDDSINPVLQPVAIQVGPYEVVVPPGSFELQGDKDDDGDDDRRNERRVRVFDFKGTVDGVKLDFRIRDLGHGEWDLSADGRRANLDGIVKGSPVTVSLTIGGVTGEGDDLDPRVH